MGTRSVIAMENEDGSVVSIYCHWDGYPSNNGALLLAHYQDREKVAQLVALGGLSSLGEKIGERHNWSDPPRDECNAYHRDRGERLKVTRHADRAEFVADALDADSWCEYAYMNAPGVGWLWQTVPSKPDAWRTLTAVDCAKDAR